MFPPPLFCTSYPISPYSPWALGVVCCLQHACAFIMQLSKKLAETDWPIEILKLPHCGVGPPMGAATRQRGPRISAAIHWDENSNWGSDATGKLYFTGMPTLVAAEVANAACAAQVAPHLPLAP